ncbi:MAG TPA: SUMF1/EgtB/PvdO family nonheme iron enzyme, partial [Kofleriaceae bacterium]|nr:SUMF1/EgtB/PvdO family nonheme iron enzyme [Kofleriaceae bacterium]
LHIALGLARGLAAVYRHGVLHRDLKPANAILARTGEVKLLDFGLAKLILDVGEPPPARAPDLRPPRAELPGDPTTPPRAMPRAPEERDAPEAIAEPSDADRPRAPIDWATASVVGASTSPILPAATRARTRRRDESPEPPEPAKTREPPEPPETSEPGEPAGDPRDALTEGSTAGSTDDSIAGSTDDSTAGSTGPGEELDGGVAASAASAASSASGAPAPSSDRLTLPGLTTTGAVIGTPAYMPPEAWRGEPATPRSDVYSLGALLYELAAGGPPHRADSHAAMRSAALEADAPPLATIAPGLDPQLAAIVDRCLARDPAQRYASGEAVRDALEALAAAPAAAPAPPSPRRRGRRLAELRALAGPRALLVAAAVTAALALAIVAARRSGAPASHGGGCPGSMVAVPAGTFEMGSVDGVGDVDEHPRHRVTLSAFCLDRTEVTVMAYAACIAAGACSAAPRTLNWSAYSSQDAGRYGQWCNGPDRPDHPVNCIDWDDAAAYCAWRGARLPTEAEWEYAARGGDDRVYPWGNEPPAASRLDLCGTECTAMARRALNEDWNPMYDADDGWGSTAPVGSYPLGASRFGALDMAGNVWEWTSDWYGPYPSAPQVDPHGAPGGTSRVSRGAGWATRGRDRARAADRNWLDPSIRDCDLGFRCARSR